METILASIEYTVKQEIFAGDLLSYFYSLTKNTKFNLALKLNTVYMA